MVTVTCPSLSVRANVTLRAAGNTFPYLNFQTPRQECGLLV